MNILRKDIKKALEYPLSKDVRINQALDRWKKREFGKSGRSGYFDQVKTEDKK